MQMTNVLIECDCHARGNYAGHLHLKSQSARWIPPTPTNSNPWTYPSHLYPPSSWNMDDVDEMRCPPFGFTFTGRYADCWMILNHDDPKHAHEKLRGQGIRTPQPALVGISFLLNMLTPQKPSSLEIFLCHFPWHVFSVEKKSRISKKRSRVNAYYVCANKIICHWITTHHFLLSCWSVEEVPPPFNWLNLFIFRDSGFPHHGIIRMKCGAFLVDINNL